MHIPRSNMRILWKCKAHVLSPKGAIHNTLSEPSLCVYIMTSMVEYAFLHDDKLLSHYGYAEALSCEKFYRGMYSFLYLKWFQLN